MNISGIRTYAGFYDYNTIKSNPQATEVKAEREVLEAVETEQQETATVMSPMEPDRGAIEYAKQYQPDATYELRGMDSDILNLDVEKALSDMSKDKVLQQYQFFVGERNAGDALLEYRNQENFYL